jgi:ubiquinone/menaquinone biosynthesis C-methylase UbiE
VNKRLNLGCGVNIEKDSINLDMVKLKGVNVTHNLNIFPYPFKDNTFDEVFADNVLEHLNDLNKVMEELSRICKEKAIIEIIVPLAPTMFAFRDPTHKLFFTYRTFEYYTKEETSLNHYTKARFKILERKIIFHNRLNFLTKIINIHQKLTKFTTEFFSQLFPPAFLKIKLKNSQSTSNENS